MVFFKKTFLIFVSFILCISFAACAALPRQDEKDNDEDVKKQGLEKIKEGESIRLNLAFEFSAEFEIDSYFKENDAQNVLYEAVSSDGEVAAGYIDAGKLKIEGFSVGSAVVELLAKSDEDISVEFAITVINDDSGKLYTVQFNCFDALILNDADTVQQVEAGQSIVKPILYREFHSYEWDKTVKISDIHESIVYTAVWKEEASLPIIYITTNGGAAIDSKEIYTGGNVAMKTGGNDQVFSGKTMGIRGRGNSSWSLAPKKSYRIKFDSKISILGLSAAKDWTLIANYFDKSLLRNYLAYTFARSLSGLPYSVTPNFVEVYLNGEYNGLYLLCEHVEAKTGRVPVSEPKKGDAECDYFLELDFRAFADPSVIQGWDYFKTNYGPFESKSAYVIKSPKTDETYYTQEMFDYISADFFKIENAILGGNFTAIEKLIDVDSFIDYFLTQELFKNGDVGFSSVFMYRQKKGKLTLSPIWDFDLSLGGGYISQQLPSEIRAEIKHYLFSALMKIAEFKSRYVSRWNELKTTAIAKLIGSIGKLSGLLNDAVEKNFKKWPVLKTVIWPGTESRTKRDIDKIETFTGQTEFLTDYLAKRLEFLDIYYKK